MNMSYCRFRNTLDDLLDCQDYLYTKTKKEVEADFDPLIKVAEDDKFEALSEEEAEARASIIEVCKRIVEEHGTN